MSPQRHCNEKSFLQPGAGSPVRVTSIGTEQRLVALPQNSNAVAVKLPCLVRLTCPAGTLKPRQFRPYVASKIWISDAFGGSDHWSMIWRESQNETTTTASPPRTVNRTRPADQRFMVAHHRKRRLRRAHPGNDLLRRR